MSGYDVRAADPTDDGDGAALAILRWTWRTASGEGDGMVFGDFLPDFVAWWRRHAGSHQAWIATAGERPIGMAWLGQVDRLPSPGRPPRRGGVVQSVFVVEEHRDNGAGELLLAAVVAGAREHGMEWLVVHPTERSVPFYRRAGFAASDGLLELRPGLGP